MATNPPRSQTFTGRFGETIGELREITEAVTSDSEPQRLRKMALGVIGALEPSANEADTVHVSANSGEDGAGNRTYTITVSYSPARIPASG